GSDLPIQFSNVSDPSHTDSLAGFTYYHRINGGAYVSSTSPEFLLPSYTPGLSYTVDGYVQDKDGGTSPVYTTSVTTGAAKTVVGNVGSGTVLLNGSINIGPNQYYASTGMLGSVQVTLQTSGASYTLYTNGSFTG